MRVDLVDARSLTALIRHARWTEDRGGSPESVRTTYETLSPQRVEHNHRKAAFGPLFRIFVRAVENRSIWHDITGSAVDGGTQGR